MQLAPGYEIQPLPAPIPPVVSGYPPSPAPSPLGPLADLVGVWKGTGFNAIWRPNSTPDSDRFLELNLTEETLEVDEISGNIPNRGLLQPDINMTGLHYLQQISDANLNVGLHIEPGIWVSVPATSDPLDPPTVVRMASIPHGTTILAQGLAAVSPTPPVIGPVSLNPFPIGNPAGANPFPEQDLATATPFRTPPADMTGITQQMVDNPNSVLTGAPPPPSPIVSTTMLTVSTMDNPVPGGGTSNTAFLQGGMAPNAETVQVSAILWLETLEGSSQATRLQYSQTVLLNFNGLTWPHVTVGTLTRSA